MLETIEGLGGVAEGTCAKQGLLNVGGFQSRVFWSLAVWDSLLSHLCHLGLLSLEPQGDVYND